VTSTTIDWVVFDLGNVVLTATTEMPRLAELLGTDLDPMVRAYYEFRPGYDRSSDAPSYWRAVAAEAGGATPSDSLVAQSVSIDDTGWSTTDPHTLAIAEELRGKGFRLALLSNAPSSMGRLVESADWSAPFEVKVFSGDHGVIKPEDGIFRLLLKQLDSPAGRTVLIDDRADNIAGAREAGMHVVLFTSPRQARLELRALGLPV
jgi:putative hydrolase of the HAD superfamily